MKRGVESVVEENSHVMCVSLIFECIYTYMHVHATSGQDGDRQRERERDRQTQKEIYWQRTCTLRVFEDGTVQRGFLRRSLASGPLHLHPSFESAVLSLGLQIAQSRSY